MERFRQYHKFVIEKDVAIDTLKVQYILTGIPVWSKDELDRKVIKKFISRENAEKHLEEFKKLVNED